MANENLYEADFDEDSHLYEEKQLTLTRNESLYLSDSITILLEHSVESGRIHKPSGSLLPSAKVAVPIETVEKIGMACLDATDPNNFLGVATISLPITDLYLLRECCQSYVKVNNELVGFNLLRKIYSLILESDIKEKELVENLTREIDQAFLEAVKKGKSIEEI